MTSSNPNFDLDNSPASYFRERLLEAMAKLRLEVRTWTEFYLVDLLARKASQVQLEIPLVLQIKAAVEEPQPLARFNHYRDAGDTALLMLGFFGDHVDRRSLSRRYVAHMGAGAYRATAALSASFDGLTEAYEDLSDGFDEFSRVLNEVRELTSLQTPHDIIRLYEALNVTKSPSVAERLCQKGLIVSEGSADEN